MKKLFFALCLITAAFTANAGDPQLSGRLTLSDGSNIFRISVGDERDQSADTMLKRIRNLEQAVGELQSKIYDLEREPAKPAQRMIFVCSMVSNFDKTYVDEGDTELEARAAVIQKCTSAEAAMFCKKRPVCATKVAR